MAVEKTAQVAINHLMLEEVGPFFSLDKETLAGLCDTPTQKKKTGYVNDPVDPGGETKFGVAKNSNNVNIKTLTYPQASQIYYDKYWLPGQCDKLPKRIAIFHFDGCVNLGVNTANKILQRALGVLDDGQIGPVTIKAICSMNELDLCRLLKQARLDYYSRIIQKKPALSKFINGWRNRVNRLFDYVVGSL